MTSPVDQSASAIIKSQLDAWGLSSLYNDALKILKQGLNADAVVAQLESTQAFKQRFWYNDVRRKAGLGVLSPAEAVATETQMRGLMRQFGITSGLFDTPQAIGNLLAKNVSPSELADRLQVGQDKYLNAPEEAKAWWHAHYGGTAGDAIAAILNPDQVLPVLKRQFEASGIGGAAARQGLSVDTGRAEQLAQLGLTADQAQAGYGAVASALGTDQSIASRFSSEFGQTEEENATLLHDAAADQKKRTLEASEAGMFERGGATSTAGLSTAAGSY